VDTTKTELDRQQWLVRTLFERSSPDDLSARLSLAPDRLLGHALRAYTNHADATAVRALQSTFPVLQALLGNETLGRLAVQFWCAAPPLYGDLADWGAGLAHITHCAPLDEWPYLADCARLEWALGCAERAADVVCQTDTLHLMALHEPSELTLELCPGCAVVGSAYPIVTLWLAHQDLNVSSSQRLEAQEPGQEANATTPQLGLQPTPAHFFDGARTALQHAKAEHAMVWRPNWRGQVQSIDKPTATWTQALLNGHSLSYALELAGANFHFDQWLVQALQQKWLRRVVTNQKSVFAKE
jgi:hypothetical protein